MAIVAKIISAILLAVARNPAVLGQLLELYLKWKTDPKTSPEQIEAAEKIGQAFFAMKTEQEVNDVARKLHEFQKL